MYAPFGNIFRTTKNIIAHFLKKAKVLKGFLEIVLTFFCKYGILFQETNGSTVGKQYIVQRERGLERDYGDYAAGKG